MHEVEMWCEPFGLGPMAISPKESAGTQPVTALRKVATYIKHSHARAMAGTTEGISLSII